MNLKHETSRFRTWAEKRLAGGLPREEIWHFDSEWESDYPHWTDWYTAVEESLSSRLPLSRSDIDSIVYALARDNEDEQVLDILENYPDAALRMTAIVQTHPDREARWQFAVLLGRLGDVERLQDFVKDEDEYVRRRATLALEEIENGRKAAQPGATDNPDDAH